MGDFDQVRRGERGERGEGRGGACLHNVVSCCWHHTDGSIKIISLDLLPITFLGLVFYLFNLIFRLQSKCQIRVCLIRLHHADISILLVCFSRNYILLVSSVLLSTCAKHFFFNGVQNLCLLLQTQFHLLFV